MNAVEQRIEELVKKYNYKKLPALESAQMRKYYQENLPQFLQDVLMKQEESVTELYSLSNTKICIGFERIVIGDYGAFIEFSQIQACKENFQCMEGQGYRYTEKYRNNVKYFWLTTKDSSRCKLYDQQRTVTYADYKAGYFYVSPYEVRV